MKEGASMRRGGRMAVLLGIVALGCAGCAGDPAEFGITGPFPEGTEPITLTRRPAQGEISDDTPGARAEALDRYAPGARLGQAAPVGGRYFGYNR